MFQTLLDSVRSVKTKIFSAEEIEEAPFEEDIEESIQDETFVRYDIVDVLLEPTLLFRDYGNLGLIEPLMVEEVVALGNLLDFSMEMYQEPLQEFHRLFANELNLNLDETMLSVYDRIRQDFDVVMAEFKWDSVGNMEHVLDVLRKKLQEVEFQPQHGEINLEIYDASCIAACVEDIVKKRLEFVKKVYYMIVCFKHITVSTPISLPLQWQWQSLLQCYSRLALITNLGQDDLIEKLIHKEMKFPPQLDLEPSLYVQKCSLAVLGKLEMTRAFPHSSIEESAATLKWAKIIKQYWPAHKVLELLDTLPVSAGQLVLKADCWLDMNCPDKAYWALTRASSNVHFESNSSLQAIGIADVSNIGQVLEHNFANSMINYYKYCIQLCQEKKQLELAVKFGKLAIREDV